MNRGSLPGYYYDEDKKKYFPITADRIAPPNAKYSETNVKREQRETKKRKLEHEHEQRLHRQTVTPARVMRHPLLGGTGLKRENGGRSHGYYAAQRDAAIVEAFENESLQFTTKPNRIKDAINVPELGHLLMSLTIGSSSVLAVHADGVQQNLHAFHDPIIAMHYATVESTSTIIACTGRPVAAGGNVYVGSYASDVPSLDIPGLRGYQFNIGTPTDTLWDCKLNTQTNRLAFAGTNGAQIHFLGSQLRSMSQLAVQGTAEAFACEWLGPQTLAVGMRQRRKKTTFHDVFLWDIRTNGVNSRIARQDRIIGLHKPDESDSNSLLVASNTDIGLYDLRIMGSSRVNLNDIDAMEEMRNKSPLFSIKHVSEAPHLHMSTYQGRQGLLTAVDRDNKMQTYSLRTGALLRTFGLKGQRGLIAMPRWQLDENGTPYLHACVDNTISTWSWNSAVRLGSTS